MVHRRDMHTAGTGMKFLYCILNITYGCPSEMLLALGAPVTTKCDFCQVSFCGINVQGRCTASSLASQHPHNMSDIGDLIQSSEVYECFENNTVEVEIMLDYLTNKQITPKQIYRDVSLRFMPIWETSDDLLVDCSASTVTAQRVPPLN